MRKRGGAVLCARSDFCRGEAAGSADFPEKGAAAGRAAAEEAAMKTISAYTLGCKVNQYDTEAMLESFERAGYRSVPFPEAADVYLINTCTVTGTGDQKSLKTVRRMAREHPGCAIVVAGCLAQRAAEQILEMDNVRLVVGVQRRAEVVELLERALAEDTAINAVAPLKGAPFERLFVTRHEGKTRAPMKIQEGCDRYCAYCIIPSVRGPVRSMPLDDVRAEARRLGEAGYREIVVTGIHLASYGRGTGDRLIDAIQAVHGAPGVARVRLARWSRAWRTTRSPRRWRGCRGWRGSFTFRLQSGSASVLRRMNRRYTPEEYFAACEALRRHMPDCAITTDVITGFPGETEEESPRRRRSSSAAASRASTCSPISRRTGTAADRMENQVPRPCAGRARKKSFRSGTKWKRSTSHIWWDQYKKRCLSNRRETATPRAIPASMSACAHARCRTNCAACASFAPRARSPSGNRWRRMGGETSGLPVLQDYRGGDSLRKGL